MLDTFTALIKTSFLIFLLLTSAASNATIDVIHPKIESNADSRQEFAQKLLKKILAIQNPDYYVRPATFPSQQDRALLLLEKGELDVVWTGTSIHREQQYRAVRIPIQKGLLGWRLMLVREDNSELLKDTKNLRQLRQYSVGLGGGWPDVGIFSDNGFIVHTTTSYEAIFLMLTRNRFDIFPRSALEVWGELENFSKLGITLDEHIVVRYPAAAMYFVNKDNGALANDIEQGFIALINSGEYDTFFNEYFGGLLQRAALHKRRIFHLENAFFPDLSEQEKRYYYDFSQESK